MDASSTYHFDIKRFQPDLSVHSPVNNGLVEDWEAYEKLWDHALSTYLKSELKGAPVLIAEKPYVSPSHRQK